MAVVEALKNSPKGQLQYSRNVGMMILKHNLDKLSPIPLSRGHEERESSKLNLSFGLDSSEFEDSPDNSRVNYTENLCLKNGTATFEDRLSFTRHINKNRSSHTTGACDDQAEKSDLGIEDHLSSLDISPNAPNQSVVSSPPSHGNISRNQSSSCPVSPLVGYTSKEIIDAEEIWESAHKFSIMTRLAQFTEHEKALSCLMQRKYREAIGRLELLGIQRQKRVDMQLQEGMEETQRILQKLRENTEVHQQRIFSKNKEIQEQRILLEEQERERQEKKAEKMKVLIEVFQHIDNNKQVFIHLQDTFPLKDRFSEVIGKYRAALERICSALATQVQAAEHTSMPLDEVIDKFEEHREKSKNTVLYIKKEMVDIEAKAKEEDEKVKEEDKKKLEEEKRKEERQKLEEQAAQDLGVQALAYVLQEYKAKLQTVAEVEAGIQSFVGNAQMKKYRFDLQRAVNTPINAISDVSGSHLGDKLHKLYDLLKGQRVEVSGRSISTKDTPVASLFCQNLVAKMLMRKGEEQVTSKHESAFAIAAVVVGLWAQFPTVGELFMGHLQTTCPYVLPFYTPRLSGQTSEDYHRSLGYKINDGVIEEQDKFLRRMSGLMRLYCACMVSVPPKGVSSPHPQGLEHAWKWLARTLNLCPHPDVTAAMIHDILSVTGHALLIEYKVQFVKLIYELQKHYLPKLKEVSVTSALVGRLEIFLETAMKNNARIPPPVGLLSQNFWNT